MWCDSEVMEPCLTGQRMGSCAGQVSVPSATKCQHWFVFKLCRVKLQKWCECYLNIKLIFSRPQHEQSKCHDMSALANCSSAGCILNVYSLSITANMTVEADTTGDGRASPKLQAADQAAVSDVMVVKTRWKSRLDQTTSSLKTYCCLQSEGFSAAFTLNIIKKAKC